jgi:hypothetical protein
MARNREGMGSPVVYHQPPVNDQELLNRQESLAVTANHGVRRTPPPKKYDTRRADDLQLYQKGNEQIPSQRNARR